MRTETVFLKEGIHCRLAIERPADGVVVVRLTGWDVGEFGDAPLKELDKLLAGGKPVELYIDARAVKGATVDVSNDWAELGDVMRIYTDPAAFDSALRKIGL